MPAYYPVFLDVRKRRCVVIGGGELGEEKATRLLDYGASVVVISPEVTDRIGSLAADGGLDWLRRGYQAGDLEGAFIAIVADTSSDETNRAASEEARERNVPLNIADVTRYCTWIAPAVVRRGDVVVAASTGGASPALARKFREMLSGASPTRPRHDLMAYADLAPMLSKARGELVRQDIRLIADHWQACLTDELVDLVQAGKSEEAWDALMSCLLTGVECEDKTCRMWEEMGLSLAARGGDSAPHAG